MWIKNHVRKLWFCSTKVVMYLISLTFWKTKAGSTASLIIVQLSYLLYNQACVCVQYLPKYHSFSLFVKLNQDLYGLSPIFLYIFKVQCSHLKVGFFRVVNNFWGEELIILIFILKFGSTSSDVNSVVTFVRGFYWNLCF